MRRKHIGKDFVYRYADSILDNGVSLSKIPHFYFGAFLFENIHFQSRGCFQSAAGTRSRLDLGRGRQLELPPEKFVFLRRSCSKV